MHTLCIRVCLALVLLTGLTACERYVEKKRCGEYFSEKDVGRWQLDDQGLATDPKTGLRWFRCNAGERFSSGQCLGSPHLMSKLAAQAYVADFALASGKKWRLPTIKEMGTLRESACLNPSINTQVFPTAQVELYWAADVSPHGDKLACAYYSFNGNSFCRESELNQRTFWLVLDK